MQVFIRWIRTMIDDHLLPSAPQSGSIEVVAYMLRPDGRACGHTERHDTAMRT